IRRLVYEELLWLASDLAERRQEHRSGGTLSRDAAARAALVYLARAEGAHPPTQALYRIRAGVHEALGENALARADRQLAARTPATLALDHHLEGRAAYEARKADEAVQAFETAVFLEPTDYWSLMLLGFCLTDLGRSSEDYARGVAIFTGCILKRPDHA